MDEDEEVIFEGNPLFNHLHETGHHDFEYESKSDKSNNDNSSQSKNEEIINTFFSPLHEKVMKTFEKYISHKLAISNIKLIRLKLLQIGLLEEDFIVLENLSLYDDIHMCPNDEERKKLMDGLVAICQPTWSTTIKFQMFGLLLFIGLLMLSWCFPNLQTVLILLLFIFFVVLGLRFFVTWKFKKIHLEVDNFITIYQRLFKSCSQSQRILNEIDLIVKRTNVEWLLSTYAALYTAQEEVINFFGLLLTNGHKRLKETTSEEQFSSINTLFDARFADHPELLNAASNNPQFKLKIKREILTQQYSGFVMEFMLLLERLNLYSNGFSYYFPSFFHNSQVLLLKDKVVLLEGCIKLAKETWFEKAQRTAVSRIGDKKLTNVIRLANGLSTCSKALLSNLYQFESLLNEIDDDIVDPMISLSEEFMAKLKSSCDEMSAEIESCSGCVNEIKSIIDSNDSPTSEARPPIAGPIRDDVKPNPTIGDADPIIVDEVFQATVTSCTDTDLHNDTNMIDGRDDRETMLAHKTHCQNVLQEMQPILRQRRTMWEKREEIALKRVTNAEQVIDGANLSNDFPEEITEKYEGNNILEENIILNTSSIADQNENICDYVSNERNNDDGTSVTENSDVIYEGENISDGIFTPTALTTLEERIANWGSEFGFGMMSLLDGSNHIITPCQEEVYNGIGEHDSDSNDEMYPLSGPSWPCLKAENRTR